MSALLSLGEATHAILNADAELGACVSGHAPSRGAILQALVRTREQLAHARATLAAVRFALRSHPLAEALAYHAEMSEKTREAARRARMVPGRGLYLQADRHEAFAAALRTLIGTPSETTAAPTENGGHHG